MIRSIIIAVSLSTASLASAGTLPNPFTSYFAFGDSLSQDDKLPQLAPPSLEGRFSSGRVWTEYLADVFTAAGKQTGNFALGGATAGSANTTEYAEFFPSPRTPEQDAELAQLQALSTFDGQVQVSTAAVPEPGTNPLVSVLFGANDIFQKLPDVFANAVSTSNPADIPGRLVTGINELADDTARNIVDGITKLNSGNSAYDDFLVVNLPDLSLTPAFGPWGIAAASQQLAALQGSIPPGTTPPPETAAAIEALLGQLAFLTFAPSALDPALPNTLAGTASLAFNAALETAISQLDDSLNVTIFKQDEFLEEFIITSLGNGKNVFEPCTPSFTTNTGISCVFEKDQDGNIIGLNPENAENFFFGDSVHPAGFVQEEFGRRVIAALDGQLPAPVPLPAGLPLLALGIGLFGIIARCRANCGA
ncbi:hypothetical protein ROLI_003680 [Roseobacter fucihabitans]|uniref:Lipolytic enzyme, G-D-S-L n=1 Tax=Roseobacter fucihabitans TaxID=1537242 RepID=A0ABZ2BN25_9RHOB|nr:SGNH/GDSL hydrolase family protein [Roseobacter litoralis]MBC6963617.1 GDSL-like Lipase/Acylhydrolase [Roseobacter litoralis]